MIFYDGERGGHGANGLQFTRPFGATQHARRTVRLDRRFVAGHTFESMRRTDLCAEQLTSRAWRFAHFPFASAVVGQASPAPISRMAPAAKSRPPFSIRVSIPFLLVA